jgi:hypothetical protein
LSSPLFISNALEPIYLGFSPGATLAPPPATSIKPDHRSHFLTRTDLRNPSFEMTRGAGVSAEAAHEFQKQDFTTGFHGRFSQIKKCRHGFTTPAKSKFRVDG